MLIQEGNLLGVHTMDYNSNIVSVSSSIWFSLQRSGSDTAEREQKKKNESKQCNTGDEFTEYDRETPFSYLLLSHISILIGFD